MGKRKFQRKNKAIKNSPTPLHLLFIFSGVHYTKDNFTKHDLKKIWRFSSPRN